MSKNKMIFKEENINLDEIKKIIDAFYDNPDQNYRRGIMEITPFTGIPFRSSFGKFISYFGIRKILKNNKEAFFYRLALVTGITKSNKEYFYVKGFINGEAKVFFYIKRDSLKNGFLGIDKMISLQKGLGRQALKELCIRYKTYKIYVEPSDFGIGFWFKMQQEYKGKINIVIN